MAPREVRLRVSITTEGYKADRTTLEQLAEAVARVPIQLRGPGAVRLAVTGVRMDPTPSSAGALILTLEELP